MWTTIFAFSIGPQAFLRISGRGLRNSPIAESWTIASDFAKIATWVHEPNLRMSLKQNIAANLPGLLAEDDVVPALAGWHAQGRKCALVTLVSVEGGSPRAVGAQMAVAEDGASHGYLSGGCLEQSIVLEALQVIAEGRNRLVRYGKGSPYFDVKLPCGSGLDIYFDCLLSAETVSGMAARHRARKPFSLATDLDIGTSRIDAIEHPNELLTSRRAGQRFTRVHLPAPRLVLLGSGPAVSALAQLTAAVGIELTVWAGDEATRQALDAVAVPHQTTPSPPDSLLSSIDQFTAVVLAFHEHELEPAILARVLGMPCFYIGVLGNHAVHRNRLELLREMGFDAKTLSRIRAPIGAIAQAKGKATLAIGVLAEILADAKARGYVS